METPAPLLTDAPAGAADPDAGDAGRYAAFLEEMDELGLLSDLEEELPPDVSAMFEIGRVLADPASKLGRAVGPALELRRADTPEAEDEEEQPNESRVQVPAAEEYEAEFIRTWSDVQHVYAWQWLLPEEEFMRRLGERRLLLPLAKAPRIRAIEDGGDGFAPSPTKQKAYVLFDTSASMSLRHRFSLAKAVALRFLRENRRELGEVWFRTFDVDVGPLEEARDRASYDALLRRVARRRTLGNGTCLEKAVLAACRDIRERKGLAGAEILIVTDGAAHLDERAVAEALGGDIELHCVKIGTADVYATDQWVEDQLEFGKRDDTRREQRILQIRERRDRLRRALADAQDPSVRRGIQKGLDECASELAAIGEELRGEYGHEIERLTHVYVQVPDIDPAVFALTPGQIESLERLARELLMRLDASPVPTPTMKDAALLLSHTALLAAEQSDPALRDRLEAVRSALERRLAAAIEHHESRVLDAGYLTPQDQRDLRILLRRGTTRYSSLWLALLRYFYSFVSRIGGRG
ncbi:MAG: hypothetical protein HMLKMBBP_01565 [Planctomycetes bacterium]|nr:hypothetical protein [Planctomycetota bacterium]